ncbi:translation initiation factor IF-3 [candidate division WOR-3 bacterium]|nr:translation initiation factor IF-3 [candidate division WOR-3 bacterium]
MTFSPKGYKNVQVNHSIKSPSVRVVDENGKYIGILDVKTAVNMAAERGYDLVMISESSTPPVCKIIDFGKFKFDEKKKLKEAQHKQTTIKVKELRMKPGIDEHDYRVKLEKAKSFLTQGKDGKSSNSPLSNKKNKVKFIVRLYGREMAHSERGMAVLNKFIEDLEDLGTVEQNPIQEGRFISMVIAPKKMEGKQNAKN